MILALSSCFPLPSYFQQIRQLPVPRPLLARRARKRKLSLSEGQFCIPFNSSSLFFKASVEKTFSSQSISATSGIGCCYVFSAEAPLWRFRIFCSVPFAAWRLLLKIIVLFRSLPKRPRTVNSNNDIVWLISANPYKSEVFVGPFFRQKWVFLRRLRVFETILRISGRFKRILVRYVENRRQKSP